ncbi:MAG: hypothetical protein JJLCMIEE_00202 [Acidimicrobiales bacterium]|nr:MAG: C4-dicarboxylate ABC transporter [Actinomycetota bacterium]MBV6507161.1 hypothetical protein [Acidimicrobiales bacterium]RIK05544.1 MAG: C4-dicarboxylate ABC transporter [Acidobacteriota bacterium]
MSSGGAASAEAGSLARLNPGWFASVMATGIVSIAAHLEGLTAPAEVLLWAGLFFYATLCVLFGARLVLHTRPMIDDLGDHLRGMGFFTIVAGTTVLGSDCLLVGGWSGLAQGLWIAGTLSWFVLVYTVIVAQMLREPKPDLETGITGTWLVWVVATQGVAILGHQVAGQFAGHAQSIVLFSLCMWLLGVVFYVSVITLIVFRLMFSDLEPSELSPTYWITMGAAAISTLAGDFLILGAADYPVTADLVPFLEGLTLLVWATASWWIPWLLIMGVWRYVINRYPLAFEPAWWGMVFPMGMYTAATFNLSKAIGHPALADISAVAVWVALAAWVVTFLNMIYTLARRPLSAGAI